ncbi:hypothetical protein JW848_10210 [Candidatus Bipolaricaulota bacterium]|nr:hypothetical protein [Candidatus Bipolaricaulota bacterium]
MRRTLAAVVVGMGLIALPLLGQELHQLIEDGLSIFLNDQVVVDSRAELEQAIVSLVAAVDIDPTNAEVLDALSQCFYTLADVYEADEDAKKDAYTRGWHYGEMSLRLAPGFDEAEDERGFAAAVQLVCDVAALQWTYSNWSRYDQFDILGAIFRNDTAKLRAIIERAIEVDPSYVAGAPYRSIAAYYASLPRLFGQDLDLALSYLCNVVDSTLCEDCETCPTKMDPVCDAFFGNRVFYAQFYLIPSEKWEQASDVLVGVIGGDAGEIYPFHNALNQQRAQALLDEQVLPNLP